ncbi:hypothetical protein M1M86_00740 [Dehalococcoidales bacterium]|nr:hypothetical protein [Dehalococcoidales bacterium]
MRLNQGPIPAEAVYKLIQEFNKLPGIGPKSAQRLTYHLRGLRGEVESRSHTC